MKNYIKAFLLLIAILISSVFGIEKVNAATLTKEKSGYYFMRNYVAEGHKTSDEFVFYYLNGSVAYCIEPDVHPGSTGYIEGTWANSGLDNSLKEKILLYAYYGYTYPNHQTNNYKAAAQALIWNTAMGAGSSTIYSTDYWGRGREVNVDAEKAEIERLVSEHFKKPSFNGQTIDAQIGKSITLHDDNNVLSNYKVSVTGADFSKSGNDLTITPTSQNVTIKMEKEMHYAQEYKVFYGDGIQNVLVPGSVDPVYASVNVNAIKGDIEMYKRDSEAGSTAQGQATLEGAKYGVYTSDGELVVTMTTDSNGYAKAEGVLEVDTEYYLKEISASNGYYVDNARHYFTATGDDTITINVTEQVVKNYISILKQYDFVDGNTTILHPESNITFDILYPDGRKFASITTDKNGYASMDIPFGVWTFHQVNTNDGFSKINDFHVTVDYNSKLEQYYNILNNKLNAYVQVTKKDAETKQVIAMANTTFKILNTDTNQFVSQYVGGKVYSEFKTDENGVFTTFLKLEAGNYRLIEISEPNGYVIDNEGLDFNIGNDTYYYYSDYGATITLEFNNTPIKGILEIHKSGESVKFNNNSFEYESILLEGVIFDIYASEDILTPDGNHMYYHKGDKVDTITTDKNGYAKSKKLPLGKYFVVEISTKDGYVLNTEEYHFELSKLDNKTEIVYESVSKLNHLKKGTLEFTKSDVKTNVGIPDTLIDIYYINDEENKLIFSGLTDKDGKIIIPDLFVGKFCIMEREPATGYVNNSEALYFEIKENGEIVKSNMTNRKITSTIKIHKVSEDEESLSRVEIGIYDLEDNLIGSYITDENGDIEFELEYGSYYYQELKTINGYLLNDEKVYFEVTEDGAIIESTLINIKVPNTAFYDLKIMDVVGLVLILTGVGYLIYDKKKK